MAQRDSDGVTRDCFICGKSLKQDYGHEPHNPLESNWLDSTDWTTLGNWCSSVHDGMLDPKGDTLHIVICDECVAERMNRAIKFHRKNYSRKYKDG